MEGYTSNRQALTGTATRAAEAFLGQFHHWPDGAAGVIVATLAAPQLYHAQALSDSSGASLALRHVWDGADIAVTVSKQPCRMQVHALLASAGQVCISACSPLLLVAGCGLHVCCMRCCVRP